jgi:hypothetical protein
MAAAHRLEVHRYNFGPRSRERPKNDAAGHDVNSC